VVVKIAGFHVLLLADQPDNYIDDNGQDNAQQDESNCREIKSKVIFLDSNVARKLAEEREVLPENKQQPEDNNYSSGNKEYFAQSFHVTLILIKKKKRCKKAPPL